MGNEIVVGNQEGNWYIKDTYHLNKFKEKILVHPLPMIRDGTSTTDYVHDLGTWRTV